MADAKAKFDELGDEEQQRICSEAATQRQQAREKPSRLDAMVDSVVSPEFIGGPLGIAGNAEFPMSSDALSSFMAERSLKMTRKEWSQRDQFQSAVCPAADFPEHIEVNEPCLGVCSSDLKKRTGAWKEEVVHLLKYLRLVVRHWLPEGGSPFWLLQCRAVMPNDDVPPSGQVYVLITHAMHTDNQSQFELECIRMEGGPSTELPFNLQFSETTVEGFGKTWPDILDELSLIRALLKESTQWVFSLAVSQTISLSRYRVTQLREIPFEAVVESEEHRLEEAAALRAYKSAVGGLAMAKKATKKRARKNTKK